MWRINAHLWLFALFIDLPLALGSVDGNELSYVNSWADARLYPVLRSHLESGWSPDESDTSFQWRRIKVISFDAIVDWTKYIVPFSLPTPGLDNTPTYMFSYLDVMLRVRVVALLTASLLENWPWWPAYYISERRATDHLSKTNSAHLWQTPQH